MSSKGIVTALGVCLATSLISSGVLMYQLANPPRPVNVTGMTEKDWISDKQFKRAVEIIVQRYGYLDEDDVKKLVKKLFR